MNNWVLERMAKESRNMQLDEAISCSRRKAWILPLDMIPDEYTVLAWKVREINAEYETSMALLSMRSRVFSM